MARPRRQAPRELCRDWPNATCADPVAEMARRFALNVQAARGSRTLRDMGEATGVDFTTIAAILNGEVWPDLMTIARLEVGLAKDLWPGRATGQIE